MPAPEEHLDEWGAIEAIYGEDAQLISEDPVSFTINLVPNPGQDEDNHVCVEFRVTLPETYPEVPPEYQLKDLKGLSNGISEIRMLVEDAINENMGEQMVFTLSEVIKDWLVEHNVPERSLHELAMERLNVGGKSSSGGAASGSGFDVDNDDDFKVGLDEDGEGEAMDEFEGEEDKLIGSAALMEVDLPHDPSGKSPLGYTPADAFTPERFQEWLDKFNLEQQREAEEISRKATAGMSQAAQAAAAAAEAETRYTGRQLFMLNLAKDIGEAPSAGAAASQKAAAAGSPPAAAPGLLGMDSAAFLSVVDDVDVDLGAEGGDGQSASQAEPDENFNMIFSPEAQAQAKLLKEKKERAKKEREMKEKAQKEKEKDKKPANPPQQPKAQGGAGGKQQPKKK